MSSRGLVRSASRSLAVAAGLALGGFLAYAGTTWLRYGRPRPGSDDEADPLLDRFMPTYDVVERHAIRVQAPPDVTFATMCGINLQASALTRAIFKGRELMLGSEPDALPRPHGLLALTKSLGWGVLAEVPGREIVMGAVTQPWEANVVFRALPAEKFASFDEPNFVKIAWTLRADAVGAEGSIARSETRVVTADPSARRAFRRYWSIFSLGIVVIRWEVMRLVKLVAEHRARRRGSGAVADLNSGGRRVGAFQ